MRIARYSQGAGVLIRAMLAVMNSKSFASGQSGRKSVSTEAALSEPSRDDLDRLEEILLRSHRVVRTQNREAKERRFRKLLKISWS